MPLSWSNPLWLCSADVTLTSGCTCCWASLWMGRVHPTCTQPGLNPNWDGFWFVYNKGNPCAASPDPEPPYQIRTAAQDQICMRPDLVSSSLIPAMAISNPPLLSVHIAYQGAYRQWQPERSPSDVQQPVAAAVNYFFSGSNGSRVCGNLWCFLLRQR